MIAAVLGCPEPPAPKPTPPAVVATAPEDAGAPKPTAPAQPELLPAMVMSLGGEVEVRRAGTNEWVTLKVGDPLRVGDTVRTKGDGQMELSFDVARMKVQESSELTLTFLDPKVVKADVSGHVEAEVGAGKMSLALAGAGSDATATTSGGRLSMYSDGKGAVSAASLDGRAQLAAGNQELDLKSGEFSSLRSGRLGRVTKIPKKVTLKIAWPQQAETNKSVLSLKGTASAFTRVMVQGHRVDSAPDGSFVAQVSLRRGKQRVSIAAIDPLGRKAVESRQITMDPDAPDIKGQVEYR